MTVFYSIEGIEKVFHPIEDRKTVLYSMLVHKKVLFSIEDISNVNFNWISVELLFSLALIKNIRKKDFGLLQFSMAN